MNRFQIDNNTIHCQWISIVYQYIVFFYKLEYKKSFKNKDLPDDIEVDGLLLLQDKVRKESAKTINYFKEQAKLKQFQKKEEVAKINMDDFSKISMVIGEIIECKKHPNADKLLVSQIKIGNEIKQIVSGIAQFYSPDELIGKKVVVVQNLESSMIRGVESSGMMLCASSDNKLEVLEVKEIPSGAIVR